MTDGHGTKVSKGKNCIPMGGQSRAEHFIRGGEQAIIMIHTVLVLCGKKHKNKKKKKGTII
jgi:hypothetical protein